MGKWAWFQKFRARFARIWSNRTPLMVILDPPLECHYMIKHYGASAILKQFLHRPYFESSGLCFVYNETEELVGWTPQQLGRAIDLVFKTNYSICACQHSYLWQEQFDFERQDDRCI